MKYLKESQMEQFNDQGFLVIEDFLSAEEVAAVKADIARVSDEVADLVSDTRGFNFERANDSDFTSDAPIRKGVLRKIQGAAMHVGEIKKTFTSEKMLDCMEDLMGPEIYYHSSKVMFKAPGGREKPWHQDAAYWRQYASSQITIWIAIDDATEENGCIWAIPESHKAGLIPHVKAELQVEDSRIDLSKAAPVPVPAGGMLIFHSLVLHKSEKNHSDKSRWAIICDYDCLPNAPIDADESAPEFPRDEVGDNNVWALRTKAT